MKYKGIAMICVASVLCMAFSVQTVCAQSMIKGGMTEELIVTEDTSVQSLEQSVEIHEDESEPIQTTETPAGDQEAEQQVTEDHQDQTEEVGQGDTAQEQETLQNGTQEEITGEKTPKPLPKPEKVTGLRLTCLSDRKVLLEWDESENVAYYRVYRKKEKGTYKSLGELDQASYTDASVTFGRKYTYKVVAVNQDDKEGAAAVIHLSNTQAVDIKTQKYTYTQMVTDMQQLEKKYSNYCELTPIGESVEGRTIYDFAIGNPNAKNSLLVVSTLHAREYICSAVLMKEIEYYLRNYNNSLSGSTPAKVLKNMQIHYIVMSNPDGVTISQTKSPRWKANSRGVDLNRNFPANKFVVKGRRGSEGYTGLKALSEPESKAIAALTTNLKKNQHLLGVVNYHAMGQIVFGDCASSKIKQDTQTMYRIARSLTGYADSGGYSSPKSVADGSYREYVMYILGIPSITLEVGSTYAPCSYWEYESAFQKNKMVVLKMADAL